MLRASVILQYFLIDWKKSHSRDMIKNVKLFCQIAVSSKAESWKLKAEKYLKLLLRTLVIWQYHEIVWKKSHSRDMIKNVKLFRQVAVSSKHFGLFFTTFSKTLQDCRLSVLLWTWMKNQHIVLFKVRFDYLSLFSVNQQTAL